MTSEQVIPLRDNIILDPIEDETTPTGIVIPGQARKQARRGRILAIGEGPIHEGQPVPLGVSVGDVVLAARFCADGSGHALGVLSEKFFICIEDDLLGRFEGDRFIPLYDQIAIEPEPEQQTERGLFVPMKGKTEYSMTGRIVAAGVGRKNKKTGRITPLDVKVGDRVAFIRRAGEWHHVNGAEHAIIPEAHVVAVLEARADSRAA